MNLIQETHGTDIPTHLLESAEIPVLAGIQCQGDLAIIPTRPGLSATTIPVPPEGVPVVRGENGGHTHLLVGEYLAWSPSTDLFDLGTVTVPDGSVGWLLHPEHGANAFAPGCYRIRRQREQREEIARVAD